jgi:Chitobiase/beta-hexosaminidase C-terminal domain
MNSNRYINLRLFPELSRNALICLTTLFMLLYIFSSISATAEEEGICARVRLQLSQDVVIARNAFKATLEITSAPENVPLENLSVIFEITDENDQSANGLFGIHPPELSGVGDVNGNGVIQPGTTAIASWLLVTTRDAAPDGPVMYYVGGEFSYTQGGSTITMPLFPAPILVRPDPLLILDYFWAKDVYSDDPFTTEIEPSEPFALGLMVSNNGFGVANNFRVISSQPQIIENEKGLLVDFRIIGASVNSDPVSPSLGVDLGNIDPGTTSVAVWMMTSTLQGQFIDYDATFTHIDGLGNPRLSLIDTVNIHELTHVVRVDSPEDDNKPDFLANDVPDDDDMPDVIYSSEGFTLPVNLATEASVDGTVQPENMEVQLSAGTPSGWIYFQIDDPGEGRYRLAQVIRSDGKEIKFDYNAWTTHRVKRLVGEDPVNENLLHLVDYDSTGSYTLFYKQKSGYPYIQVTPATIDFGEQEIAAGPTSSVPVTITNNGDSELVFTGVGIEIDGPDSDAFLFADVPLITPLASKASRIINVMFDPASTGDKGSDLNITTSDPYNPIVKVPLVGSGIVLFLDSDNDGMADEWELLHFETLERDGSGDFDGDGISDLQEFLNGTNPISSNAPTVPQIVSPENGTEVSVLQPDLVIQNSTDPDGDEVTYEFEIYVDEGMTSLLASQADVAESADTTSWSVPQELDDNAWYYWRARATDGIGFSEWAYGSFFVNRENDPPGSFNISRPEDTTEVDTLAPTLAVSNSTDVDGDAIAYTFEVYADSGMSTLVASSPGIPQGADGTTSWVVDQSLDDNTWHFWRAIAIDEHGAATETLLASFFVNTAYEAPEAPEIVSPAVGSEVDLQELNLVVGNAFDPEGDLLTYFFELDKVDTFDGDANQTSGETTEGLDTTSWHVPWLDDNTTFFWRAKANDGYADSPWALGNFFVNTLNDAPSVPTVNNPGDGAWVETPTPTMAVNPSTDLDNDIITYRFEVYADEALSQPVLDGQSDIGEWLLPAELDDNTWYFWRSRAEDEHGATSEWMNTASFFVNDNGYDDPPEISILEPAVAQFTNENSILIRWEDSDPDSNAGISLYFDTDQSGAGGTLIVEGFSEDPDVEDDSYHWDISGMAEGTYYVYGIIDDGNSSDISYAPGTVIIDRIPPAVTVLPPGGNYDTAQTVTLSADEAAEIYYTLDGTDPTAESPSYTDPIDIIETTTLKCIAVDDTGNWNSTLTEIYTISTALNAPPVADAGEDFDIALGETAYLDGSASDDPDNGPEVLAFSWYFVEIPPESILADDDIMASDTATPYFQPDVEGTYKLELEINDGEDFDTDQINITCTSEGVPGDLDGDGIIGVNDYNIFISAFGKCDGQAGYHSGCDYDGDNCITFVDYQIWYGYYMNQ